MLHSVAQAALHLLGNRQHNQYALEYYPHSNSKRQSPQNLKPKTLSTCTITLYSKYILVPILPMAELMLFIKFSMAYIDVAMQVQQFYDPFLALAMVCSLLADALTNNIVRLLDRKALDKSMWFFAEQLGCSLVAGFGEEIQVVVMLVGAIPQGPWKKNY